MSDPANNMLSDESLAEFKEIWKAELDEDLSDKDATAEAISLLTLFNAIYRPVKKEWLNRSNGIDKDTENHPKTKKSAVL
jgi:hypothetical protein